MTTIAIWARKHGVGTSVVATMLAAGIAARDRTLLIDQSGSSDTALMLGTTALDVGEMREIHGQLVVTRSEPGTPVPTPHRFTHTVIDAGCADTPPPADRVYVVTTLCYLAMTRLVTLPPSVNGLIVVAEPGRSLRTDDAVIVSRLPLAAVVDHDPAIARAVDAGLLGPRSSALMGHQLRHLATTHQEETA